MTIYPYSPLIVSMETSIWPLLMSGTMLWAAIIQLIPVPSGPRGALKDSSWVIVPSILKITDWPFIHDESVINKNLSKGLLLKSIIAWRHHLPSSAMSLPSNIPRTGSIEKDWVPSRGIRELSSLCWGCCFHISTFAVRIYGSPTPMTLMM